MTFANIVRLNVYTTDVDETLTHWEVLKTRLGAADVTPPMTLLMRLRLGPPRWWLGWWVTSR